MIGIHARTDGFTSLAVVLGVIWIWLGFALADPIVGLAITLAIFVLLCSTARGLLRRRRPLGQLRPKHRVPEAGRLLRAPCSSPGPGCCWWARWLLAGWRSAASLHLISLKQGRPSHSRDSHGQW